MTQGEIEMIMQLLVRYGFEAIIAGIVVFLLLKFFLPGYLTEKGKNLATSEDIANITKKIEAVKADCSVLLEELKSKHQLKLAAIDKRLEVHQEAFTLWRKLMTKTNTDEIGNTVIECQTWWEKNCLYLEPTAREAFSNAYHAAAIHKDFLHHTVAPETMQNNWLNIKNAGQIILSAVELPQLTDSELKELPNVGVQH
jgi:hypothetical protein